jgi:hypothetical protein
MRLLTDGMELAGIETNCDGRDVPMLVAEIRRLAEIVDMVRRIHEARLQYESALRELEICEQEMAKIDEEFSRMLKSLCP